jgi:hypothetical protein
MCGALMSLAEHNCYKKYCSNCSKMIETGHLCYMAPFVDRAPSSDRVLYVFYDFETTQNTACSETSFLHVPNLVCVQQLCENETDIDVRFVTCGVRRHSFWTDPVVELITYLHETRPWADRIVYIAHNAKALDLHFVLNRVIQLKWTPDLIMNGQKIMCVKGEGMTWLDTLNYRLCSCENCPKRSALSPRNHGIPTCLTRPRI